MDVFRAELRIIAVMGLLCGALGVLMGLVTAPMMVGAVSAPRWLIAIPIVYGAGGVLTASGGRGVWRALRPERSAKLRSELSALTFGFMACGTPGLLFAIGLLKSQAEWANSLRVTDALAALALLLPVLLAAYAGFVGMRLRIALRGLSS